MAPETEALACYLSAIDFTYFCTFTTRKPISVFGTRRIAEKLARHVDAGGTSTMFWAAEKFDVREGYHFHALLKLPIHWMSPTDLFAWYFPRYGRCQIIDNQTPEWRHSAAYYCAKYITKSLADYDLYLPRSNQLALLYLPRSGMKPPPE